MVLKNIYTYKEVIGKLGPAQEEGPGAAQSLREQQTGWPWSRHRQQGVAWGGS